MKPNWRSAARSSGASLSTSRYSFSALSYCSAAKYSLARDKIWSLVGSSLEQPALVKAIRESARINRRYPEGMLLEVIEVLCSVSKVVSLTIPRTSAEQERPLAFSD